jgi:hypothetical protein
MFPPPGRAKLLLSRKPSRRLSIFPRPHTATPRPNLAHSSSPSGTTRRNSCDGAPQLAQGAALRFVGYREFGLFVPRHPANPREVAGLARDFTQSHRALGRSLPACRDTGQRPGKRLRVSPGLDSLTGPLDSWRANMLKPTSDCYRCGMVIPDWSSSGERTTIAGNLAKSA